MVDDETKRLAQEQLDFIGLTYLKVADVALYSLAAAARARHRLDS